MYSIEALKRKIAKEGLDSTINYFLSTEIPSSLMADLEKLHIFNNGHLCLSLLVSLAKTPLPAAL